MGRGLYSSLPTGGSGDILAYFRKNQPQGCTGYTVLLKSSRKLKPMYYTTHITTLNIETSKDNAQCVTSLTLQPSFSSVANPSFKHQRNCKHVKM